MHCSLLKTLTHIFEDTLCPFGYHNRCLLHLNFARGAAKKSFPKVIRFSPLKILMFHLTYAEWDLWIL